MVYLESHSTDPYFNLALEEYIFEHMDRSRQYFLLWQNDRTIVVGKYQNTAEEINQSYVEAHGIRVARRLSGGGAVYHDKGNLNFTFLTVRRDYDVARQTETILQAVRALGIPVEKNGRNDLTAAGGKFSGHAYYQTGEQCYHHGTLMVSVDLSPLAAYLQVSPLKLEAKGVKSVRARVVNLTQFRPELTIAQLRQALVEAFGRVYGLPVHPLRTDQLDAQALARGRARFADPAWVYGDSRPLAVSREARFTWGLLRLDYSQAEGSITQAALWSGGLEADFLSQVPGALQGCPRQPAAVRARLMALKGAERTLVEDILTLLMEEA